MKKTKTIGDSSWPIFATQSQAAAATGIPVHVLKAAKDQGCPAFKFSRVYIGEFIPWYFAQKSDVIGKGINYERERLMKEQADEKSRENAIADKLIHTREAVESELWENGLAAVRAAWLVYPKTAGARLKAELAAAGVKKEVIEKVFAIAVEGVNEPLNKIWEQVKE